MLESADVCAALKRTINFRGTGKDEVPSVVFGHKKDEGVTISLGSDTGDANEIVSAEIDGEAPKFVINGNYMLAFCSELGGKIEVRHESDRNPVWIRPSDKQFQLMIVMPIDPRFATKTAE